MRAVLLACLSLVALLMLSTGAIAQNKALTPLEFNDDLSSITDSLYTKGQAWGQQFNTAFAERNFSSLKPPREMLERYVNKTIARLTVMKDVKDSKALRLAMLNFLRFEQKMIDEGFKPLEKLTATVNEDDLNKEIEKLKSLSSLETGELQNVQDAQTAYAKANGFKLEGEEGEEEAEK